MGQISTAFFFVCVFFGGTVDGSEILHQLRLVVSPITGFYTSQVVQDLFHQQYFLDTLAFCSGILDTPPETNSSHLKIGLPKRKGSYSNHPFLGASC